MGRPNKEESAAKAASADRLWMPRQTCAILLKMSPSLFDHSIRPRLEEKDKRLGGNVQYYYAPSVVAAHQQYLDDRDGSRKKGEDVDDEVNRRIKTAKAEMAELEALEAKGKVVSVEDWEQRVSGSFWTVLNGFSKTMKRSFGNEGVMVFNDFLAEARRALGVED